jgi:hypothetical protein
LQQHFREVVIELRARDTAALATAQRANRAQLIEELERYSSAGLFPQNLRFPEARMPYFVDDAQTRCAMAHLIEWTGSSGLVARMASTNNHAFVHELEADAALARWLDRAGLTLAEAARIQPTYTHPNAMCFCPGAVEVIAEGTVLIPLDGEVLRDGFSRVRIDLVHQGASRVKIGDEVFAYRGAAQSESLLLVGQPDGLHYRGHGLDEDGMITVECWAAKSLPPLSKEQAIAALSRGGGPFGACAEHLKAIDEAWGGATRTGVVLERPPDPAASALLIGGATTLLFGGALLVFLWRRRRRRSEHA